MDSLDLSTDLDMLAFDANFGSDSFFDVTDPALPPEPAMTDMHNNFDNMTNMLGHTQALMGHAQVRAIRLCSPPLLLLTRVYGLQMSHPHAQMGHAQMLYNSTHPPPNMIYCHLPDMSMHPPPLGSTSPPMSSLKRGNSANSKPGKVGKNTKKQKTKKSPSSSLPPAPHPPLPPHTGAITFYPFAKIPDPLTRTPQQSAKAFPLLDKLNKTSPSYVPSERFGKCLKKIDRQELYSEMQAVAAAARAQRLFLASSLRSLTAYQQTFSCLPRTTLTAHQKKFKMKLSNKALTWASSIRSAGLKIKKAAQGRASANFEKKDPR